MSEHTKKIEITRKIVISNLLWRFLERFGVYVVSFVISIILARILEPSTYGIVALMTVIISFLDVFVTGGFASSLIHDKTTTEKDFNTLLIFNISLSIILYIFLYIISPFFAAYYRKPLLVGLIRVSGLSLLIHSIKNLQYAYAARRLEFKKFFLATLGGTIISGLIGVILALKGFGAWALVIQNVINHMIDSIILWFTILWRPKIEFSYKLFLKHFSFGWKILIYKIIYNISNNIRQLVIGKKYSDIELSFFNRGKTYPNLIGQNITNSVNSVMYPVLAKTQDDSKRFNEILSKSFIVNSFILLPICALFFCVANTFIQILLGYKWLPCVPFIRLFCIIVYINSIEAIFSNGPLALGKSTESMAIGVLECLLNIILLIIAIPFGIMAIGYSIIISSILNVVLYCIYLKRISNFIIFNSIKESLDSIFTTIIMCIIVYIMNLLPLQYYILFIIQVIIGIFSFYIISRILNNKMLTYCTSLASEMLGKRK